VKITHKTDNVFFRTQPKDAYLPNVENIVPLAGNEAYVFTWGMQTFLNDYEFQQAKTLLKPHSFTFINCCLYINGLRTFHPYPIYAHLYCSL
jgi:hypothetical protein